MAVNANGTGVFVPGMPETAPPQDPSSLSHSNPAVVLSSLNHYDNFSELGGIGLRQFGGYLSEEWDRPLQGENGRRITRQMIDSDPVVAAVLHAIEWLARQVTWNVNPASQSTEDLAAKEFLSSVLFDDLDSSWNETLSEILSFVGWGWMLGETVFKPRWGANPGKYQLPDGTLIDLPPSKFNDGKIGLHKIALRAQESILHWDFDNAGGVRAMVQIPPPDYRTRTVPLSKALLFRTVNRKGNPEPPGIIRAAYTSWLAKVNIQKIEAIGIERDLTGIPVALVPPRYLQASASPDEKALLAQIQKVVRNIRVDEQQGVVFPLAYDELGHLMFELKMMASPGTRQHQIGDVVDRYDQRIATSMLADFVLVGSKGAGSLALARTKCMAWDEPVTLVDGRQVPAHELIDQDFEVLAVDDQLGIHPAGARARDNGVQPVVEITTASGRSIRRTLNHPLRASLGGPKAPPLGKWVPAGELGVGDSLAVYLPWRKRIADYEPASTADRGDLPETMAWERVTAIRLLSPQPTVAIGVDGYHTFLTDFVEHNTNFFALSMGVFLDHIAEVANKELVPRLFRLNGMDLQHLPQIAHSRVAVNALEDIAAYITALAGAGMSLFPSLDGVLERHLLEMADLPTPQEATDEDIMPQEIADVGEAQAVGAREPARLWQPVRRLWAGFGAGRSAA